MSLYPFDSTGMASTNTITETHAITSVSAGFNNYIVPDSAPFFNFTMVVVDKLTGNILVEGIDYVFGNPFEEGFENVALPLSGSIAFLDQARTGNIELRSNTLGGDYTTAATQAIDNGLDVLANLQNTDWSLIANIPAVFPATPHNHSTVTGVESMRELLAEVILMRQAMEDPYNELTLSDITDLETGYINPLITSLTNIANALTAQTATATTPFEMSTPGRTRVTLGPVVNNVWTDTPITAVAQLNGTYMITHNINAKAEGTTADHKIEAHYVVNDALLDRGFSNGAAIGLTVGDVVKVRLRIVGSNTSDLVISDTDHSSALNIIKLGA